MKIKYFNWDTMIPGTLEAFENSNKHVNGGAGYDFDGDVFFYRDFACKDILTKVGIDMKGIYYEGVDAIFNRLSPTKVIFNGPATIVFWEDGTKTVVKCAVDDMAKYSPTTGFAYAVLKKLYGTSNHVQRMLKEIYEFQYRRM